MRRLIPAAFAIVAVLAPTAARASITVGPAMPNPNPSGAVAAAWPSGRLLVPTEYPAPALVRTPSEGVITSWRLYTDDVGPEATVQLYAVSETAPGEYTVSGNGPKEALAEADPEGAADQNVLNAFPTALAVPADAYLGVRFEYPSGSTIKPVYYLGSERSMECLGAGCPEIPPPGTSGTAVTYGGQALAMNATLEPDADHDGYGDETQDSCVGVCQTSAPVPPGPQVPAQATKKKCKTGKRLKHGKCVKKKRHRRKKHRR